MTSLRRARSLRLVTWLLLAATVPLGMIVGLIGGGLAEHCVVHGHGSEVPAQHAGNHASFETAAGGPGCPHCPATSCAMLAPCAAPQTVALHPMPAVWADPIQLLGPSVREAHGLHYLSYLPPTPPPRKLS